MSHRPAARTLRLATLWLCWCGLCCPALASPTAGGTLHSAGATLLSLAAPAIRQRSQTVIVSSSGETDLPNGSEDGKLEVAFLEDNVTNGLDHEVLPVQTYKYTESTLGFIAFYVCYMVYTAACVWYELRQLRQGERAAEAAAEAAKLALQSGSGSGASGSAAPAAPKQRFVEWDLIKAVMLFFVIVLHTGRNGWLKGGLTDSEQTFFLMLASFPMPIFAFVSGVFGSSIEPMAMKKTLCYTIGTFLLAKLLGGMIILATPGPKSKEDVRCVGYLVFWYVGALVFWYCKALAVWRFSLTPLFHFARKRRVPDVATFLTVYVSCYFFRHMGLPHWTHEWIYFAPYYAQGLLLPPARWSELLASRRCKQAAFAFLFVWIATLTIPEVRRWNDVACTHGFAQCPNSHWPANIRFDRRAISAHSFIDDVRIYALQDGLSMAVAWVVASCAGPLQAMSPRLAAVMVGCGTRTLYGYVLHFLFWLLLGVRMGVNFPNIVSWKWCLLTLPLAAQANFVFCSALTEYLFSWAIMPFWILRVLGQQPQSGKV